jgi:nucleoside 2-deoxyribosyltransferase
MSKPSVFISSSQRDAKLVGRLKAALERAGLNASNPARESEFGKDWRKSVQSAIKSSDAVVILALAPQNLSSGWTAYEAGIAETLGKRVMLLLPNRNSVSELPADFASTQVVEFDPQSPERAARDVAARLGVV